MEVKAMTTKDENIELPATVVCVVCATLWDDNGEEVLSEPSDYMDTVICQPCGDDVERIAQNDQRCP